MSGTWGGKDPLLRVLRAISILAFLVLIAVVVLDPGRTDATTLAPILAGAILLQLGYAVVVPGLSKRDKDDDDR